MRKPVLLALSLAFLVSAQSALAAGDAGNFGTPIKSGVSVSFPDSSATFQPTPEALELLADARNAAIIYISGRTSTLRPSAADEALHYAVRSRPGRTWWRAASRRSRSW